MDLKNYISKIDGKETYDQFMDRCYIGMDFNKTKGYVFEKKIGEGKFEVWDENKLRKYILSLKGNEQVFVPPKVPYSKQVCNHKEKLIKIEIEKINGPVENTQWVCPGCGEVIHDT